MPKRWLLGLLGTLLLTLSSGCGKETVHTRPADEPSPPGRIRRSPTADEVSKKQAPKNP